MKANERLTQKAIRLINQNTYSTATVLDGTVEGKHIKENKVISSDDLVDIFFELYPKAADVSDDRYAELRQFVLDMGLTIVPGEDIIDGEKGI